MRKFTATQLTDTDWDVSTCECTFSIRSSAGMHPVIAWQRGPADNPVVGFYTVGGAMAWVCDELMAGPERR